MAMIGGIAQTQRAAIRLQLDGLWSVQHLSRILSQLVNAYDSAVALHYLGTEEFLSSKEVLAWIPPSDSKESDHLSSMVFSMTNMALNGIRLRAGLSGMPLQVHKIQLASPGTLEAVGLLDPLRTVFGFVFDLRNHNIRREHQQMSGTRELLDRIPEPIKEHYASVLLDDIECEVVAIARDQRVREIDVAATEQ